MTPPSPELSIVICTYNRRVLAARAVESIRAQTLPPSAYEILLVDNNSTDGTLEWANEHARSVPRMRVIHEPRQGLSFARNRAAREARAKVVAFLDDDAVASPGWAAALLDAFASGPMRTVAVGGRIELEWTQPRPRWLPNEALGYLGYFTLPPDRVEMKHGIDNIRGGNMAVERDALLEVGAFDTSLGRSSSDLMGNEEVEFQRRLEQLGRPIVYAHDAVIHHLAHPERLHRSWFIRRAFDQGRSDARLDIALANGRPEHGLGRSLFRTAYNTARASLAMRSSRRIRFVMKAAASTGAVLEGIRLRRARIQRSAT